MTTRTTLPQATRFAVFRRDDFTCRYCGRSSPAVVLHVEHVHPVARGGSDALTNLVTACADCNSGKGARVGVVPPDPSALAGPTTGLVGLAAHEVGEDGTIARQCAIRRDLGNGRYLVEWFSWVDGAPNGCEVVTEDVLLSARFVLHMSVAAMQAAYEREQRVTVPPPVPLPVPPPVPIASGDARVLHKGDSGYFLWLARQAERAIAADRKDGTA